MQRLRGKRRNVILWWILLGASSAVSAYWIFSPWERTSTKPKSVPILVPALCEASGLASSHHSADLLWSHNDSGGQPVLYGFATNGAHRGTLRITGAKNVDWEAISSFEMDGKAWITIGDMGDNLGIRRTSMIYVIEEPTADQLSPLRETPTPIAWSMTYRFEDGSHDCEALLVDIRLREILLVTKRLNLPQVYLLPLRPKTAGIVIAKEIGTVAHLPQPNLKQKLFPVPTGRFLAEVTDGAISPDGFSAALLTYGNVLIFSRGPGENWAQAFQREPVRLAQPELQQAEALCYSPDGKTLFVTGEQKHPVILRYDVPIGLAR